jgi:hypothetical protein
MEMEISIKKDTTSYFSYVSEISIHSSTATPALYNSDLMFGTPEPIMRSLKPKLNLAASYRNLMNKYE